MNTGVRRWVMAVASVLAMGVTASLGFWQLDRAAQKQHLQATMDAQAQKPALNTAALLAHPALHTLWYQAAEVQGHWLAQDTVFLDNRQMQGRVGFYVLTPLRLAGSAQVVLVQRGWVARNFLAREALPAVETPTGLVRIAARIAPPPSKLYAPGAPGTGRIRQNLDLAAFASETGMSLLPVSLQQMDPPSEGLLREWPVVQLGIDKHYGYAAQWFALCALLAGLTLWFQLIRPFIDRSKDSSSHV